MFVRKRIGIFLLSILLCAWAGAQENSILSEASPKLKKFISDHPEAAQIFTNAISSAFSNKTVRLYYFYSDNKSEAPAFHYYPNSVGLPDVAICVRENQSSLDEFITILFETLNSKNENGFRNLWGDAYSGTISREQFARKTLQYEFEATETTRALLLKLKFRKEEIDASYYYRKFADCPSKFEDFLSYSKRISPHRDALKEYEIKYDELRKISDTSNSTSNSPAKH
jgi:hypothetical protein